MNIATTHTYVPLPFPICRKNEKGNKENTTDEQVLDPSEDVDELPEELLTEAVDITTGMSHLKRFCLRKPTVCMVDGP